MGVVRAACLPVSSHDALCLPRSQYLLCESPTPVHRMNMLYTWSLGLAMSVCLSGGEVSDSIQGQQGPDMENLWSQTSGCFLLLWVSVGQCLPSAAAGRGCCGAMTGVDVGSPCVSLSVPERWARQWDLSLVQGCIVKIQSQPVAGAWVGMGAHKQRHLLGPPALHPQGLSGHGCPRR